MSLSVPVVCKTPQKHKNIKKNRQMNLKTKPKHLESYRAPRGGGGKTGPKAFSWQEAASFFNSVLVFNSQVLNNTIRNKQTKPDKDE